MARVTVEDCLGNVDNLFQLVLVATKRSRQLARGVEPTIPWENDKPTVVALREIAAGNIGPAILDEVEYEYLYNEGDDFHFMNTETYEQMHLTREMLGETVYYLIPNTIVKVEFFEDKPIGVDLPDTMELKVVATEPTLQKATASAVGKPATLETGLVVTVPPFVNEGDRIKVDTSEARYVQRVE